MVTLFAGGTFFYGFGVLFEPIIEEFGWSAFAAAAAFSLRSEVGAVAAPLAGFLVDRIGPQRVTQLGLLVVGTGFVFLAQVNELWTFYAAFCVIAVGNSAAGGSVGMVAVSYRFRRTRSRALSLMTVGAGLSGLTVPLLAWLVGQYGWRPALMVLAGVILGLCLPARLLIRGRPENYGLLPDGERAPVEARAERGGRCLSQSKAGGPTSPLPQAQGMLRQAQGASRLRPSFYRRQSPQAGHPLGIRRPGRPIAGPAFPPGRR